MDPHVKPSIVTSWVRLWLVQIGNRECITTHQAAPIKLHTTPSVSHFCIGAEKISRVSTLC